MALAFVGEEIVETDAEDHGDSEKRGERGEEPSAFEFREHGGREPGVLSELDQSHALTQAQGAELLANFVRPQTLNDRKL